MPDKHALLGPSNSHRWTVCTPSPRLEENFPNKGSKYAEEGTIAHSVCELKLKKKYFKGRTGTKIKTILEQQEPEMDLYTDQYVELVEEEYNEAKAISPSATLFVEQQIDFSDYVPEGFGTSDAVIATDTRLIIIDFKYGKGVAVDAENNPQLKLYALGSYLALEGLYDFEEVKMVICQPRINSVSEDIISIEELLDWAENVVKPAAKLAWEGKGEFVPGEHCRFCRAGALCKARAEKIFPVVKHDKVLAPVLTDEEIPELMKQFEATRSWMDAVEAYAQDKAVAEGKKWDGFKLVEARTVRKITDPIEAAKRLDKKGYSQEDYTTTKLKGIGDLERLVGKKDLNALLNDLIVKPNGAPVLAPETDKRAEYNPTVDAFKEEI